MGNFWNNYSFWIIFRSFLYCMIKCIAIKENDEYAFNWALGLNGGYAFFSYLLIGFLMFILKEDYLFENKKDVPFSFTFHKNAFIYYIMELILFSGNFFNILAE